MDIYSPSLKYYVYAYVRKKDSKTAKAGTPYYIGKGSNDRAWRRRPCDKVRAPEKNQIIILEKNLTSVGAFALERRYIEWYGRKDNKTGILINLTDGGEGVDGYKHNEERRKKISLTSKGRPSANKGKKQSPELLARLSAIRKGKKHSEKTKETTRQITKEKWQQKVFRENVVDCIKKSCYNLFNREQVKQIHNIKKQLGRKYYLTTGFMLPTNWWRKSDDDISNILKEMEKYKCRSHKNK